jgi:thiosulfate/3-mercaptopyruvate sulfurtransferase
MVEELTPEELKRRLDAGENVLVVDIRGEGEFRRGHIPGAVNVPFHSFAQAVEDRDWEGDVVMACPVGQSSKQAARLLESYEGVDPGETTLFNLEGGYRAWEYGLASSDDGAGADGGGGDGDGADGADGDGPDAGDAPF